MGAQAVALSLAGIFPPVPTPFDAQEGLDLDGLGANIRRLLAAGVHGVVILGSNGEYVHLSEREKISVMEAAIAAVPGDRPALVGTAAESTRNTITLTREAARLGAAAALVVTPHYYKPQMGPAALIGFYRAVADSSPLPILIYNVPKFTGIDAGLEVVRALADHPNIIGIKDSSGNVVQLSEILAFAPNAFHVLVGSGSALYPALAVGASGGIVALANVDPVGCVRIYDLVRAGRLGEALAEQKRLLPVNRAITATYGISGLKLAMDWLGYAGGLPRRPLLPLSQPDQSRLRAILREGGLLN